MKTVSTLFFVLCSLYAIGQTDSIIEDILKTRKYREGLFRHFDSFLHNAPEVSSGYFITQDSGKFERYRIRNKSGGLLTKFYGFSDGDDVYVSAQIYCEQTYYVRIEVLGPITYFIDIEGMKNAMRANSRKFAFLGGAMFGLVGRVAFTAAASASQNSKPVGNPGWIIYLGDDDGQAYLFDQRTLLSIFKNDNPPMYERLKAEKDKNSLEMLVRYVEEFNKLPLKKSK